MKFKTGDKVKVIAGKDKGKEGSITKVIAEKNRVVIDGINIVKKHRKADASNQNQGGVVDMPSPINASNVMLLDPKTKKPIRVNKRTDKAEKK
jgi:large subunit ribosomal protein L24